MQFFLESIKKSAMSSKHKLKKVPLSFITNPILQKLAQRRVAQWNQHALHPKKIQIQTLLDYCQKAAQTEFGKEHGLATVKSYEEYKKRVPLRLYSDFEHYIDKMKNGVKDILWPGLIPYFGMSSGSSNTAAQHKFLPISMQQVFFQRKMGFDLIARYLALTKDQEFTAGFHLGLLPPSTIKVENCGIGIASNPGIMLRHLPFFARQATIPKRPIRDIADYDEKLKAIANTYLNYNVHSISGTTCWFSVMFDNILKEAQMLGKQIHTVSEIWPNLRVLFGGGIYAAPYKKIIEEKVGRPILLMDNYNATEGGVLAATDSLEQEGMLMIPDRGVFFEFIPRSENIQVNPIRLPLWEVEIGREYSIAVTTCSGLFSYIIGDFIKFTSIFPHRIEFTGRASGVLSLTQELTSFIEIERSFASACKANPCTIIDYTATSEVGVDHTGKGRYLFFIEFEKQPENLISFLQSVDNELCQQNRVYKEHRAKDVAILSPRLIVLPKGASKAFMKALGYTSIQHKFPRIINEKRKNLLFDLINNNLEI